MGAEFDGRVKTVFHADFYQRFRVVVEDSIAIKSFRSLYIPKGFAHQSFDGVNGISRVGDEFVFGRIAYYNLLIFSKMDHGRHQRAFPIGAFHTQGLPVFHICHETIGRTQVDSDNGFAGGFDAAVFQVDCKSCHNFYFTTKDFFN